MFNPGLTFWDLCESAILLLDSLNIHKTISFDSLIAIEFSFQFWKSSQKDLSNALVVLSTRFQFYHKIDDVIFPPKITKFKKLKRQSCNRC